MKEAIIVGLDGYIVDVVLVENTLTGVSPIYQYAPVEVAEGEEPQEPIEELIGHQVSSQPYGLYKPKWNFETEEWVEGLTPEEFQEIQNAPIPETDAEKIARLEAEKIVTDSRIAMTEDAILFLMDLNMPMP